MADELKTILIKDLQEAESAADTDYIAIDNGTVTKKIRVDNYNKTANGTAKSYAESAKESADKAQRNADSISSTISERRNMRKKPRQAKKAQRMLLIKLQTATRLRSLMPWVELITV